jgi:hypothetical protein
MENELTTLLTRINELINDRPDGTRASTEEIFLGTLSVLSYLYGENSIILTTFTKSAEQIRKTIQNGISGVSRQLYHLSLGALNSAKKDIELGLVKSIEKRIAAEVYSDFILMAKSAIDNSYKDVSAVMVSAAFEDMLKKYGKLNGILNLEEKDLTEVINALSAASLLGGPQLKILRSHVGLRNKAMHAEWDKIDTPEVKGLIAFTEEFIIVNPSVA